MKHLKNKFLRAFFSCCLLFALLTAAQAAEPTRYEVNTAAELVDAALKVNAAGGEAEIVLKADITLSKTVWQAAQTAASLTVTDNALSFTQGTVTLLGEGHSITADAAAHRGISVSGSAVLNLGAPGYAESLTIRGGGGDAVLLSPLVSLSGAAVLNVYDGAALRDTLSLSTPGGVQLSGTAELNMHGGVIENCNNSASVAGGVVVDGAAVFRLCGGTIRGCKGYGGAVAIGGQGRMELSAGLIENCESLDCGGAILLASSAPIYFGGSATGPVIPALSMTGGTIRGCTAAEYGGGVALYAYDAAAELTGGVITGCSAAESGGGAACLFGTLTVNGCAVYDNTAADSADDVFNYGYGGTLTLGALPDGLTLTATGKPIDGWYRDRSGAARRWSYQFANTPAAILTQGPLTASTQEHTIKAAHGAYYTVTYDLGGGTGTGYDPVSVAKGAQHTLLPAPTQDGHVFTGWKVGSTVKRPGEKITVNNATTVSAQWLTVDEWIRQRLNIRVYVDVDVSVAIGTDQQQQEISADVSEASQAWLHAQVEEWIRALLAQGAPLELDAEHAAMLLRLLSAGADSVDVTLTVGVRLTGDPDEGELALLSPHMDGSETAQAWQLTVELGAEAKKAGVAFDQVEGFAITELDDTVAIHLTTGQDYSGRNVRVLYIHGSQVKSAQSSVDKASATVTVYAKEFSPYIILVKPTGGGSSGSGPTRYTLRYESNGGTAYPSERYSSGTVVTLDKLPEREGYAFTGWYGEAELTTQLNTVRMDKNRTVYAGWSATPAPAWLNSDDHFAYVYGYPDGHVGPLNNITRAEVAAIFYRLLRKDIRVESQTTENSFDDVPADAWYVTEVSTLARLGVFVGRTTDVFAPDAPITRAEFATVCARFDQSGAAEDRDFSDIGGHWAEQYIRQAAALGWVQGYPDGTFGPDRPITRAEAVTMINRVLRRNPGSKDDLLSGMKVWPDNPAGAWYYLEVQEATNGHEFHRKADGHEKWTVVSALHSRRH